MSVGMTIMQCDNCGDNLTEGRAGMCDECAFNAAHPVHNAVEGRLGDYLVEVEALEDSHRRLALALAGMLEWARRVKVSNPGMEVAEGTAALRDARRMWPNIDK